MCRNARYMTLVMALVLAGCDNSAVTNQSPLADDVHFQAVPGQVLQGQLAGRDADGDDLRYILMDSPRLGRLQLQDPVTGRFLYLPDAGQSGRERISYRVSDGTSTSATATLSITLQHLPAKETAPARQTDDPQPEQQTPSFAVMALAAGEVDLQISFASADAGLTVSSGDIIPIDLTITNAGTSSSSLTNPNMAGFYVGCDLIREPQSNGLRSVDDKVLVSNLGPGQNLPLTLNCTVPRPYWLDGDGQYYLKIVIDSGNNVLETMETNNERVLADTPVQVRINDGRDISMDPVSVASGSVALGDTLIIDNKVTHHGMDNETSHDISFWLATDETDFADGTAQLIGLRHVSQSGGMSGMHAHQQSTGIPIPFFVTPGTYILGAVADHFQLHREFDTENNNALSLTPIQVTRGTRSGPDLVLENFALSSGDSSVKHGEFFQVDLTISNRGDMASFSNNVNYARGIPLTIEATDNGGFTTQLYWEVLPDLEAGQSINLSRWITFQNTNLFTAGPFTLRAVVDPELPVNDTAFGKHLESDENNNDATININVSTPNASDMIATGLINNQTQVGIGHTVNFSYTVANPGSADVSSFKVGLIMKLAGSDTVWDLGRRPIPWLPGGGSSSETLLLTVPEVHLSSGFTSNPATLQIIAVADSTDHQFESDENNNSSTAADISVFVDTDLGLSNAVLPVTEISIPGTATLTVNVANSGTTASEDNSTITVYLSGDGTSLDYIIGIISLPPLGGGDSLLVSVPLDLDKGLPAGSYTVITEAFAHWDVNSGNNRANSLPLTLNDVVAAP